MNIRMRIISEEWVPVLREYNSENRDTSECMWEIWQICLA